MNSLEGSKAGIKLIVLVALFTIANSYKIQTLEVTADSYTINVVTQYTIGLTREFTSEGITAPWETELVPAGSLVTITFPSQYTNITNIACQPPYSNCYVSGKDLIIPGLFTVATALRQMTIVITNVKNPSPSGPTGEFMGKVGNDYTVESTNPNAILQLEPALFQNCSWTFSPATVNRANSMVLYVTPTNKIPLNGSLVITFPIAGYWFYDILQQGFNISTSMVCTNLTSTIMSSLVCTGGQNSNGSRTITVTGFLSAQSSSPFGISISGILSPPTTFAKDILTITTEQDGQALDRCQATVSGLQPNTMTLSITPTTSMFVNQQVSLRFIVTLTDIINNLDTFLIVFPTGSRVNNLTVSGGGVMTFNNLRLVNSTNVTFGQLSSNRNFVAGSSLNITFSNYTAPTSTQTTSPISLFILRDTAPKMVGSATLQALNGNLTYTVAMTTTTVNTNTSYTFTITTNDPISSTGRIKIDFPTTVKQSWTATKCAQITSANMASNPDCNISFNSLILSNLNISTSNILAHSFSIIVYGITNPPTTEASGTFTISTFFTQANDTLVATSTMGSVVATVATLNRATVTITPSSWVVAATNVSYTVSFNVLNPVPANGQFIIGIPKAIGINAAGATNNCGASLGGAAITVTQCFYSQSTNNYVFTFPKVLQSTGISAGSSVSLLVGQIFTNPPSTLAVSTFTIQTLTQANDGIDQLLTDLKVNMTTPADFSSFSIKAANTTNGAITAYTLTLSQPSAVNNGSYLDVIFPSEVTPSASCKTLAGATISCNLTGKVITLQLPNGTNNTSFGVIVSTVRNPPSLKPTSKFGFRTRTPDGTGMYSQNLTSTTYTNTEPSKFTSVKSSFQPGILKEDLVLTLNFTPSSNTTISSSALLTVANSFITTTLKCNSLIAFSGVCQALSDGLTLNISGSFGLFQMSAIVSGLRSPSQIPTQHSFLTTYDSSGFIMDQSQSDILFVLDCPLPCRTCSGTKTNCTTCYNDTAITSNIYYFVAAGQCLTACPDGFFEEVAIFNCSSCNAVCKTCDIVSTNCTSCNTASANQYLNKSAVGWNCLAVCDTGMYPNSNSECVQCVLPCKSCQNETSCLSCFSGRYLYQKECLLACPVNITVANNSTDKCDNCSENCLTCLGSTTNCSSCAVGLALHQGKCVTRCPDPLVNKTGVCGPCDSPCLTCSETATNCTSCISTTPTPHYLNNSCREVCPAGYYNESLGGDCLLCSSLNIGCSLCINATACISCDADRVFMESNKSCLAVTPTGYANISGIAKPCEGDCATCQNLTTTCTSCKTLNLINGRCENTCPPTSAPVAGVCVPCRLPCTTCSLTIDNCTACSANMTPSVYLSGQRCVETCPDTTYANSTLQQCVACVQPCRICVSQVQCTTCISGYNLYRQTCLNGFCPAGYLPIASVCVACTSPCKTCSNIASSCNSCLPGLSPELFLSGTSCIQASLCPSSTYADLLTNTCTSCIPPCLTCSSATTCLSCIDEYSLEAGKCRTNCSAGLMPVYGVCTACIAPCATCAGTLQTCLSCNSSSPTLYLSGTRCVTSCPDTTYANGTSFTCQPCQTPCAYCSSLVTCKTCMGGFYLFETYCYEVCPVGYVGLGLNCIKCTTGCFSCQGSPSTCTSCTAGYYLMNKTNECVANCPDGLYEDPIEAVCIGCTPPCAGCTGTTNNCTICATGSLYNNTCIATCPQSYYSFNKICEPCAAGCRVCTSLTRCSECLSTFLLFNDGCLTECPATHAVIVGQNCTACSKPNCKECNAADFCLVCNAPNSIWQGECVEQCPSNYSTNGTHCVQASFINTSSQSIFPMPFTIASVVVVIMCLVSKLQNQNTFASAALYAFLGIFQWGSLIALIILYALGIGMDFVFGVLVAGLAVIYILNIVAFTLIMTVYRKDTKFLQWTKRSCGIRTSFIACLTTALVMCHKFINIIFSRLFGFGAFKAQLEQVNKFFWLHLVSILSLVHSGLTIGICGYIIHLNKLTVNQLLLCAIDTVIVTLANVLVAGSNANKAENFLEQFDGDMSLNKKMAAGEESCHAGSVGPYGQISQRQSAYCGKYFYGDSKVVQAGQDSVAQFVVEQDSGQEAQANQYNFEAQSNIFSNESRNLADVSVQALQILDEQFEQPPTVVRKIIQQIEQVAATVSKKPTTNKTESKENVQVGTKKQTEEAEPNIFPVEQHLKSEIVKIVPKPVEPKVVTVRKMSTDEIDMRKCRQKSKELERSKSPPIKTEQAAIKNKEEELEVINIEIPESRTSQLKRQEPRQSTPPKTDRSNQSEEREKQEKLQRLLRQKEAELQKIRLQVKIKERQHELKNQKVKLQTEQLRKSSATKQSSSFTVAAQVQDPIMGSKLLKKQDTATGLSGSQSRGRDMAINDTRHIEQSEVENTVKENSEGSPKRVPVETDSIDKSIASDDKVHDSPIGKTSPRRIIYNDNNDSKELSEFSQMEETTQLPILLAMHGDMGIQKSRNSQKIERLKQHRTLQLPKRTSSPNHPQTLIYGGDDDVVIEPNPSPSDFDAPNQRFIGHSPSKSAFNNYQVPSKPQIYENRRRSSSRRDGQKSQPHAQRQAVMVGVKGPRREHSSGKVQLDDRLAEYYHGEKMKPGHPNRQSGSRGSNDKFLP